MSYKTKITKTVVKTSAVVTTASVLSLAVSNALYAAEPKGVQLTDNLLKASQTSNLPKRYIVKYKQVGAVSSFAHNSAAVAVRNTINSLGAKVKGQYPNINVISAELSDRDVQLLAQDSNVEYVEEDLQIDGQTDKM